MSGTFDEKGTGSDSTDKRPAPTIEGTATEVSVEPGPEEAEGQEAKPDEPKPDEPTAETLEAGSAGTDEAASDEAEPEAPDKDGADGDDTGDAGDDSAAAEAQPVPASEASGRSFGSRLLGWIGALFTHALAGLAGGFAVLAALSAGYLPMGAPQQAGPDAIETRIAALESAPKTADNAAALEALTERLAAVESASGDAATLAVDPAEIKALAAQVGQLEASLRSMAEAAKDGGSVADAAAISQQIAEAEQRLDSQIQSKIQSEVQSALASGAATGADDETVEALKSEIADLDAKLKALTAATMSAEDGSSLKPEISALERRLNEIETTLPSLEEAVDAENAQTRKANLAIVYSGLREAVNAGRPYATELAAMTALSTDMNDLEDLSEYERTGIPTVPMLTTSFASLRDKALAAEPEGEQDLFDRLVGSAQSLVKVRRIDQEADGTGPDAILARADAKLEAGKLHEAVLEVEKLRGPQAKIFGPWIDDALARLDANTALQRLQDALLASLASSDGASQSAVPPTADEETE